MAWKAITFPIIRIGIQYVHISQKGILGSFIGVEGIAVRIIYLQKMPPHFFHKVLISAMLLFHSFRIARIQYIIVPYLCMPDFSAGSSRLLGKKEDNNRK